MKQAYQDSKFRNASLKLINTINSIIDEYKRSGDTMTVRQLYYQLVARDIIPNTERSYKNTTNLVNEARMCGLIDWSAIEDRTREFTKRSSWTSPAQILRSAASSYHEDMWASQKQRVVVIVEKEALVGVLQRLCHTLDLPMLAARGYPSSTVLREFVLSDVFPAVRAKQKIVILHLGDHDPSGIDMTRDLTKRFETFAEFVAGSVTLHRIALTWEQIEEKKPPPNPAKSSDSRFNGYADRFGESSWELDALSPTYLRELVERHTNQYIDQELWAADKQRITDHKERLEDIAQEFEDGEGEEDDENGDENDE